MLEHIRAATDAEKTEFCRVQREEAPEFRGWGLLGVEDIDGRVRYWMQPPDEDAQIAP